MFISSAIAQTAPAAAAGGDMASSLMSMLPLVLMFVVLYFVMIRPQMKRQKEHRAMIDALAKGDEVATAGGDMTSSLMSMLPLVLMFVVLYFVMIRPQMKRQKEHRAMIDALAKGDEIATAGGLLGKVTKLGDSHLGVEIAAGVEIQLQRSAVVQVLPKGTLK